jgi:hypothetical protein
VFVNHGSTLDKESMQTQLLIFLSPFFTQIENHPVFFSSETCRMTSFTAKALDSRMFDIYSSTEIVLLALDTLIMFGCFACSITGCTTCINNGRYYYDKDDEIDQLYYKYIEEGGQLNKDTSEPLLSGEDVQDEDNGSNLVLDSNESGGDGGVERGIKGDGTRVRRKKTRNNYKQNRRRKVLRYFTTIFYNFSLSTSTPATTLPPHTIKAVLKVGTSLFALLGALRETFAPRSTNRPSLDSPTHQCQ